MNDVSPRELNRHLFCLNRRRSQFMTERLAALGLAGPMHSILLCLENRPGINQDFLVGYLSVDKGTIARLAKRLETLNYITRTTSDDDHRVYRLELTDAGRATLLAIHDLLNQWSDKMLAGFSEADRQTTLNLLQRMADNISE
jgi:DNA-binding MarR family transcriptional regulator